MEKEDIRVLSAFIKRIGMYAPGETSESIISFINGYELGRRKECEFSKKLSELLEEKYKYKKNAMGWIGQLYEYGKENNLTWKESFKMTGLELIRNT